MVVPPLGPVMVLSSVRVLPFLVSVELEEMVLADALEEDDVPHDATTLDPGMAAQRSVASASVNNVASPRPTKPPK